ncbi:MAG: mismatch-specific DNA-glycosylase [Armatimonadota bacterium]|nr:mismatch-specific DNA-glycosylase [bacterium]
MNTINRYLQDRLKRESLYKVTAIQAALWLHQADLLKDSASRPGLPLRNLLRKGQVRGQHQEPNGRWYIRACGHDRHEPIAQAEPAKPEIPIQQVETDQPHVLPDYLRDGLDIVFVGTAASDVSAVRKHYYSGYNNAFYKCIFQAGIVPVPLGLEDDWRLPEYGVGLTDMVKNRHAGDDSNLSRSELSGGAPSLKKKIIAFSPKIVCFNGKTAYTAIAGSGHHHYGLAGISIGSSKVFVVPSTSGRVNADVLLDGKTRLQWFRALAQLRDVEKLGGSCV